MLAAIISIGTTTQIMEEDAMAVLLLGLLDNPQRANVLGDGPLHGQAQVGLFSNSKLSYIYFRFMP